MSAQQSVAYQSAFASCARRPAASEPAVPWCLAGPIDTEDKRGDSSDGSTGLAGSRGTSTGRKLRGGIGWRSSSRERTGLIGSRGTSTGAGLRGGSGGGSRPGCGDAGAGLRDGTFGPHGDSHFDLNIVD